MKNNFFFKVLILILVILIVLIDLPENYPLKINIGKFKYQTIINPLSVNFSAFGISFKRDFKTKLGLDLQGGSHLVFEADMKNIKTEDREDALISARDIIERRVNFFGVSEPVVQYIKYGKDQYRINVDLPGIDNTSEAITMIGKIAQLDFRELASDDAKIASTTPLILRLSKKTELQGKHIKKTSVQFDQNNGNPQVGIAFTDEGAKIFAEITARNIGKPLGIFLDDTPISAPNVEQEITGGQAVINGNFTLDQARELSIAINSGSLPVPIKLIEQRNIGATLGAEQIQKSIYAGLIGLATVVLFMVFYYGRLGIIASMALFIYAMLSLAVFRLIPVVMTLSGVAGFILSIGMAVDSNILIFERIKEEIRKGKDFDLAIRLGFGRAISAIKDANLTTLLVSFILFNPLNWDFLPQFGLIKGFALTLAIGVIMSLFTGVVITKRLIQFFYKKNNI